MFTSVIIRGLPGSGKSTFAKHLCALFPEVFMICEADQYFTNQWGEYKFEADRLYAAHKYCSDRFNYAKDNKYIPIVSNTSTQLWEFEKYITEDTLVIKMDSQFDNIHNVPPSTILRMTERWEDYRGEVNPALGVITLHNVLGVPWRACPFCGNEVNRVTCNDESDPLYSVLCPNCQCEGPAHSVELMDRYNYRAFQRSVAAWNMGGPA